MTNVEAGHRLNVLDGWRGISILLVLAAHLLPVGPKSWRLNDALGPAGMALFFTLSGFLITRGLMEQPDVRVFLVRRCMRIVPLAWLGLLVTLWVADAPLGNWVANLLFVANLPPQRLVIGASHYWSLGVEMQFYGCIALLVAVSGRRGLLLLPCICVAVTLHRMMSGAHVDIVTWRRVDEILAGSTLALAFGGLLGSQLNSALSRLRPVWLLVAFLVACHPESGSLNYLRPYLAALLVGSSIFSKKSPRLHSALTHRALGYIASISYALYVLHGILVHTWLGSGDTVTRYAKRPLLFAATFALAHISTHHFESRFIAWGKLWCARLQRPS